MDQVAPEGYAMLNRGAQSIGNDCIYHDGSKWRQCRGMVYAVHLNTSLPVAKPVIKEPDAG